MVSSPLVTIQNSIDQMHQMHDKRGPYYDAWLIATRAGLQRQLRKLEAEIIKQQEEVTVCTSPSTPAHG